MAKLKAPESLNEIKVRALSVLSPIRRADELTRAKSDFHFWGKRTNAGRSLPPQHLVFFLFSNLLGFKNMGISEKVAWSIPIVFNGRVFLLEHRKLGVGVFVSNLNRDEDDAREIVRKIHQAVKIAKPFFEYLANNAVGESKLNVKNQCMELFGRYEYLLTLYRQVRKKADKEKGKSRKETKKTHFGSVTSYYFPTLELHKQANWLATSTIEAFFSWTEHIFIHLAILAKGLSNGNDVANLTGAEWKEKFKSAISLDNLEVKKYFDELVLVRQQLRNNLAHGAFGKNGETFSFHSSAGAVPVLMPHQKGKNRFSLTASLSFDEDTVLELIANFVSYLWSSEISPAMFYLQENGLPTILTMAQDGTYSKAMGSMKKMRNLVEGLSHQIDQATNMDW